MPRREFEEYLKKPTLTERVIETHTLQSKVILLEGHIYIGVSPQLPIPLPHISFWLSPQASNHPSLHTVMEVR